MARAARRTIPHRDLYPLSVVNASSGTSRNKARCTRRHQGLDKQINDVCRALNAMDESRAGLRLFGRRSTSIAHSNTVQAEARSRIGRDIRSLGRPPPRHEVAGSLSRILKSTDVYSLDRDTT